MHVQPGAIGVEDLHRNAPMLFICVMFRRGMGRNEESLLRAASEKGLPASATRGGSCTHPDQSWMLAHKALKRDDLCVGTSSPILPFFLGGGVALHECLGCRIPGRLEIQSDSQWRPARFR